MKNESPPPAPPASSIDKRWLTETETAMRLNLSKKFLQKDRLHGGALRFAKFGASVRYAIADIEEFERASLRTSTSDPGPDQGGRS